MAFSNLLPSLKKDLTGQIQAHQAKAKLKSDIAASVKAESDAVKASMATKMTEQRKIRLGRAGRRSLLSGSFMGIQDKAATLG